MVNAGIEVWLFLVFALWPFIGTAWIGLLNATRRRHQQRPAVPPAGRFGEVLARMYLWPVLIWRARRKH